MRHYETAFLITPKLEEEEMEKLIEQMAEVVKKKKGKMVNIEKWGKRKLAYPIEKLDEAVYVFFHYEGNPDIPFELQRKFRQTESVLRYLTLKKDEKAQTKKRTKTVRKGKPKKEEEKRKVSEEELEDTEQMKKGREKSSEEEPEVPHDEALPESEIEEEEKK